MKLLSLCLVKMGKQGLELVKVHPDILPKATINEIVLKSMPLSSKEGDFTSTTVGDCIFEGVIFAVPSEERRNIASLIAIFDDTSYDRVTLRKFFSFTLRELEKNGLVDIETIMRILPNLFEGLAKKSVKIKISSVVTLEFNFDSEKDKEKDSNEKFLDSFGDDVWSR